MSRWFRVMWKINKENIKRLKISSDLGEALQLFRANENQSNVGKNNDDNMLISLLFFHFYFLPFFTFFFVPRVISIFSICSLKKEHFFYQTEGSCGGGEWSWSNRSDISVHSVVCLNLHMKFKFHMWRCCYSWWEFLFSYFSIHFWTFFIKFSTFPSFSFPLSHSKDQKPSRVRMACW